jgi:hypothetical protein
MQQKMGHLLCFRFAEENRLGSNDKYIRVSSLFSLLKLPCHRRKQMPEDQVDKETNWF